MSNCVTHHACDCIMDKVIKYEKLQKELESVKAEKENLRRHLLSECRNHKATLDELENLQREMTQVKHIYNIGCNELAAQKAKANELLEALENLLGHLDASLLFPHKERSDLVKAESLMRQAIAKYRQAEGQR